MAFFTDQIGKKLSLGTTPVRIVSLVPSQTELLFDLGLEDEVCGITKFCIHPEKWHRTKPQVGGTKQLKVNVIRELRPDLIIANKEENVKEQVEELQKDFPVWTSDVNDIPTAYDMINQIGMLTDRNAEAKYLVQEIRHQFSQHRPVKKIPVAYLLWRDPYMTAGGDTFINAMLTAAGFKNVYDSKQRYPRTDPETLNNSGCKCVLLSSEPFPFSQKHVLELQDQLPGIHIELVDGEMFSWYGSRLLLAPPYFSGLYKKLQPLC
jgi:ABC-type Fe3+-hydroxamate transport system substrate-binding protein